MLLGVYELLDLLDELDETDELLELDPEDRLLDETEFLDSEALVPDTDCLLYVGRVVTLALLSVEVLELVP